MKKKREKCAKMGYEAILCLSLGEIKKARKLEKVLRRSRMMREKRGACMGSTAVAVQTV